MPWTRICAVDDVEIDDVMTFTVNDHLYAVYRTEDDEFFCSDGLCTHEQVDLADGLLMGHEIECPKHNGRFDIRTGAPLRSPVCVALGTYPTRMAGDAIMVDLP